MARVMDLSWTVHHKQNGHCPTSVVIFQWPFTLFPSLHVTFAQPTLKWQYYLLIYCPGWCSLHHCFYPLTPIKECYWEVLSGKDKIMLWQHWWSILLIFSQELAFCISLLAFLIILHHLWNLIQYICSFMGRKYFILPLTNSSNSVSGDVPLWC